MASGVRTSSYRGCMRPAISIDGSWIWVGMGPVRVRIGVAVAGVMSLSSYERVC